MLWLPQKDEKEIKDLFLKFFSKHKERYDSGLQDYIQKDFFCSIGERGIYSELMQLYSEFEIYSESDNPYIAHFNNIKNIFNLGSNVLEVASGAVPALANIIAKHQIKIGSGTITIYDPSTIIDKSKYSNLVIKKEEFNSNLNISNYGLIVSILPCLATEEVITAACSNKKDFYIAFCGCDHFAARNGYYSYGFFRPSYLDDIELAKRLCDENGLGELVVTSLEDKYEIEYPIIYNKRR